MQPVSAITLWQPWASLVAIGRKTIETRTHDRFRCLKGRLLAIHAGATWDAAGAESLKRFGIEAKRDECPVGAVLALAGVWKADWLSGTSYQDHSACIDTGGRFGLWLTVYHVFDPPVPAKGHQGIWYWQPDWSALPLPLRPVYAASRKEKA